MLTKAHLATNSGLRKDTTIDDTLSGTTAISLLLKGNVMYFSNLGDSRAILISETADGRLVAKAMSSDQTPYRRDERERVKRYGARVLTMEQIEGNAPIHENWGDLELGDEIDEGGDPPRIWSPLGDYPGTAFTRSIGDFFAESLGVVAEPEFTVQTIDKSDKYVLIASDGVFEFLTNQMTADMIRSHEDLLSVCRAVVEVSYGLWLQYEYRTDDITIVLIAIDELLDSTPAPTLRLKSRLEVSVRGLAPTDDGAMSPRVLSTRPVRRRPKRKMMILNSTDEFDEEGDGVALPSSPKTPAEIAAITTAIKANFLFQNIGDAQREQVIDAMVRVEVSPGEVVILQGDKGDRFYIVDSGRYEVRVQVEEGVQVTSDSHGNPEYNKYGQWRHEYTTDRNMHPCFGELSLMYGKPRGATVIALEKGVLWALNRRDFRKLLLKSMSSRRKLLDNLRRVKILRCLDVSGIQRLADLLSEKAYKAGDYIITQGTPGDNFYMLIEGRCHVTFKDKSKEEILNRLVEWDYFGEKALLSNDVHSSNVIASTDVRVMYFNKKSFDEIFGPLAELIDRDRKMREEVAKLELNVPQNMKQISLKAMIAQSETYALLSGSFGEIKLTSQSFVLMKAREAGELKPISTAIEVGTLLRQVKSAAQSFLPTLVAALRDPNAVHLIFKADLVSDLSTLIKHRAKMHFSEQMLAYIAACVVTAIGALHQESIICRGIQPENLYLDIDGRVVLFDFRTCKINGTDMLCYTLCGASDYLAPEQVSMSGHGRAVDFWALGVLLHEVSTGANPFAQGGEVATFNKISSLGTRNFPRVSIPNHVIGTVKGLIEKLLISDPNSRLGMGADGIAAIKREPLFTGVNWSTLFLDASPLQPSAEELIHELAGDVLEEFGNSEGWYENSNIQLETDMSPSF